MWGMNHWQRLGELLERRRVELGFANRSAFGRKLGLSHTRVLSDLERAKRTNFDPTTLTAVEVYYEWEPGSVDAVLQGGDPRPLDQERPSAPVDDVYARLANLDRQVDALWKRVEALEAGEAGKGETGGGASPGGGDDGDAGSSGNNVRPLRPDQSDGAGGVDAGGPEPGNIDRRAAEATPGKPSQYTQGNAPQDAAGEENQDPNDGDQS